MLPGINSRTKDTVAADHDHAMCLAVIVNLEGIIQAAGRMTGSQNHVNGMIAEDKILAIFDCSRDTRDTQILDIEIIIPVPTA